MRYVWWNGEWVEARWAPQPRLAIIRDHMEPLRHMATGEIIDSKSQFRAATKASGCVEVGNDVQVVTQRSNLDRKELREDIGRAYDELAAGRPAPQIVPEGEVSRRYG